MKLLPDTQKMPYESLKKPYKLNALYKAKKATNDWLK